MLRAVAAAAALLLAELGASAPVTTYVALGDSIAGGTFASHVLAPAVPTRFRAEQLDGTNYTALVARGLTSGGEIEHLNLGIPGAFAFTVWNEELPKVPARSTIVTLSIGVNDALVIAQQGAFSSGGLVIRPTLAYWQTAVRRLVDGIRAAAPRAKLVVANVPNLAFLPSRLDNPPSFRHDLAVVSDAMNETIDMLAREGVTVVDLRCDPQVYRADRFADSVHPNDAGYAHVAERFLDAIHTPKLPSDSCAPYSGSAVPAARQ